MYDLDASRLCGCMEHSKRFTSSVLERHGNSLGVDGGGFVDDVAAGDCLVDGGAPARRER